MTHELIVKSKNKDILNEIFGAVKKVAPTSKGSIAYAVNLYRLAKCLFNEDETRGFGKYDEFAEVTLSEDRVTFLSANFAIGVAYMENFIGRLLEKYESDELFHVYLNGEMWYLE